MDLELDTKAFEALGVDFTDKKAEEEKQLEEDEITSVKVMTRMTERHYERRVKSELALEQELPWHFENGCSYHCISHGDVDSLTYLRAIVNSSASIMCFYRLGVWQ